MIRFLVFFLLVPLACLAENYLLSGGQASEIQYEMQQNVVPTGGVAKLSLSYVVPKNFQSPSFSQVIRNFDVRFSIPPATSKKTWDARGNEILQVEWLDLDNPIKAVISFTAVNQTKLAPLKTTAAFPLSQLPEDVRVYLRPTALAPSNRSDIRDQARRLTASAQTEFDAVQQILSWLVDRITYVQHPERYDALYSFTTGKGNCQNYSHLSAACMRAVGIPVRIVNGVTLREPYAIKTQRGSLSVRMAQGRHSWIEVYFPDLGWVPFDPQQMELFTSNRFIRVEVGLDNEETISDGYVRWRRMPGSLQVPLFQEVINSKFVNDRVSLTGERQTWGPRKLLFCPPVEAAFTQIAFNPEQEAAPSVEFPTGARRAFTLPDTVGNLEFPQNEDFLNVREIAGTDQADEFTLRKNFLVETAEYVTSKGDRYAQTFLIDRPLRINKIGLALHKFGGSGNLWLELVKDDGSGKPGPMIETSDFLPVESMPGRAGYAWHDFTFTKTRPEIGPGRYWIVLAYSGSPIVNWFFSYGKPVGPNDGTRYNTLFDETWSRELAYEFNYRVIGQTSR